MNSADLKVAMVQLDTIWENPEANLQKLDTLIDSDPQEKDIIILPETFSTGFSMNVQSLALPPDNFVIEWMYAKASGNNAAVTGSMIIREGGKVFNRLIWMNPDGSAFFYDKRHLFRMGRENEHFHSGNQRVIIKYKGWNFLPIICYDLRFPVWSRNRNDYDVLICVANWPASRDHVWNTLLMARAIENQVYVAGVNRFGKDQEAIIYEGGTRVINPKGEVMKIAENSADIIIHSTLSYKYLKEFRKKFPVHKDADDFRLL